MNIYKIKTKDWFKNGQKRKKLVIKVNNKQDFSLLKLEKIKEFFIGLRN